MNNWYWSTPIALATEEPVAQFKINGTLALAVCIEPLNDLGLGLGGGQPSKKTAIHTRPITRET